MYEYKEFPSFLTISNFSRGISILRKKNNLDQVQVGLKMKCHANWIGRVEREESLPNLDFILKAMQIFSCSFEDLFKKPSASIEIKDENTLRIEAIEQQLEIILSLLESKGEV